MERDRSTAHVRAVLADADGLGAAVRSLHDAPEGLRTLARSALADAKAEEVATRLRNTPVASRRRLTIAADLDAAGTALWTRARVVLLRLALEHALADLWSRHAPELARANMRAQLLVLPRYVEANTAWRDSELWHALSRVTHRHAYELTPIRSEIERWHRDAEMCVASLDTSTDRRST